MKLLSDGEVISKELRANWRLRKIVMYVFCMNVSRSKFATSRAESTHKYYHDKTRLPIGKVYDRSMGRGRIVGR